MVTEKLFIMFPLLPMTSLIPCPSIQRIGHTHSPTIRLLPRKVVRSTISILVLNKPVLLDTGRLPLGQREAGGL